MLPVDVAGSCALTGLQRPLGGLKCLLGGLKVPAAEPAAKKPRLADGAGRLWAAASVGQAPLAAAAGPVERRQLKRAAHRPAEGAACGSGPLQASFRPSSPRSHQVAGCKGGRIGEAANPGPAKVLSANCTSLKGAWKKLVAAKPDLLILQEVRCSTSELAELARQEGCQVVYGEELEGTVLVAAFAWTGALQKISRSPTGLSHHFQWKVGGQSLHVHNGYFQGATAQERQLTDGELTEWLEQAELAGEPTLIAGDFKATRSELEVSRWFEAAGW